VLEHADDLTDHVDRGQRHPRAVVGAVGVTDPETARAGAVDAKGARVVRVRAREALDA